MPFSLLPTRAAALLGVALVALLLALSSCKSAPPSAEGLVQCAAGARAPVELELERALPVEGGKNFQPSGSYLSSGLLSGARKVHCMVRSTMADTPSRKNATSVTTTSGQGLPATVEELPVVARLIVEVRSDGTRTIARGAMEDAASDTRVAIEASGGNPLELAMGLAKSIFAAPWLRRHRVRGGLRALLRKP